MHRLLKTQEAQDLAGAGLTALSVSSAGWAWLTQANEILTALATLVAIASGIAAIRYHHRRTEELKKDE